MINGLKGYFDAAGAAAELRKEVRAKDANNKSALTTKMSRSRASRLSAWRTFSSSKKKGTFRPLMHCIGKVLRPHLDTFSFISNNKLLD